MTSLGSFESSEFQTVQELKSTFKLLSLQHHPDKTGGDDIIYKTITKHYERGLQHFQAIEGNKHIPFSPLKPVFVHAGIIDDSKPYSNLNKCPNIFQRVACNRNLKDTDLLHIFECISYFCKAYHVWAMYGTTFRLTPECFDRWYRTMITYLSQTVYTTTTPRRYLPHNEPAFDILKPVDVNVIDLKVLSHNIDPDVGSIERAQQVYDFFKDVDIDCEGKFSIRDVAIKLAQIEKMDTTEQELFATKIVRMVKDKSNTKKIYLTLPETLGTILNIKQCHIPSMSKVVKDFVCGKRTGVTTLHVTSNGAKNYNVLFQLGLCTKNMSDEFLKSLTFKSCIAPGKRKRCGQTTLFNSELCSYHLRHSKQKKT